MSDTRAEDFFNFEGAFEKKQKWLLELSDEFERRYPTMSFMPCGDGGWDQYDEDHYYRNRQKMYDFGPGALDEWDDLEEDEETEEEEEEEAS